MDINVFAQLTAAQQEALLERPAHSSQDEVQRAVSAILAEVRARGDAAVQEYAARFDHCPQDAMVVTADEVSTACARVAPELKAAIDQAIASALEELDTSLGDLEGFEDFGTLDSQELSAAEDFSAGLDTEDMDIETFEDEDL